MKANKTQKYQKKKRMNMKSPSFPRKNKLLYLMRAKMRK